jgi:hypothetical protein
VRSTSVFTKKPISPSISRRERPAIGLPTTMSSLPLYLASSTWNAASSVMYSVAPSCLANAVSRDTVWLDSAIGSKRPRYVCIAGRG